MLAGCHRLAQNSLLSRVKTMLNSGANREKTQRLEVIQRGLVIDQCVFRTPNDPNPACDCKYEEMRNCLVVIGWVLTVRIV